MTLRTWHIEFALVAVALVATLAVTGSGWIEVVGSFAVLATFGHAQVADRLAEREALRVHPEVACHGWAKRYWFIKEFGWLAYFMTLGCWSALVGVITFLAYPVWRAWYRRRFPVGRAVA